MKEHRTTKVVHWILNIDYLLAIAAFIVLVAITFSGALSRYLLHAPFIWLEELQMALIIVFVFAGASAAARAGSDIVLEVFVDALPIRIRRGFEIFAVLVTSAVLIFYIYNGVEFVQTLHEMSRTTNILKIPNSAIQAFIPVGCVGILINTLVRIRRDGLIVEDEYRD